MGSLRHRGELVARLAETWFRRPPGPNRVVMSLTRRCNLRCNMCLTWATPPARDALTAPEVGALMRDLHRLTWLDLTGGEIFTRRDAEEVFDEVLANTPALRLLHFPTNGWFTERVLGVVEKVRNTRPEVDLIITVSLDGVPEVHDRIRGREGSFDRALATFRAIRDREGVEVYVGTTITAENEARVDELGLLLAGAIPDFNDREWHWNWLQESQHFFKNSDVEGLAPSSLGDTIRAQIARRGVPRSPVDLMELGFLLTLRRYLEGEPTRIPCQSLRSTCFVSPEGDVFPCHVWDRPLGNVREQPFARIWNAATTREAREEVKRLDCGGCFTPCEAYPALAGSPLASSHQTLRGLTRLAREALRAR